MYPDNLIIGGGVIGLSLAWELARQGKRVQVIDRGPLAREASWAGAGILPPASRDAAIHPYDQLCALASELHPRWAAALQEATGIDTGYRTCGGLYLASTAGEAAALAAWAGALREQGVAAVRHGRDELAEIEPGLAPPPRFPGLVLPEEAQLRNPRHLAALAAVCEQSGVTLTTFCEAQGVALAADSVASVQTTNGPLIAGQYCFTSGAWTGQFLARHLPQLGTSVGIVPIRGQMLLYQCPERPVTRIINEGSRYIVPRDDGYLLAGSTEEEADFDKRTTAEGLAELTAWATSLIPSLRDAPLIRSWAGLRPGSFDGLPYLGPIPGFANAYLAAGHFRSGLYLSPATAVVMSELLCGIAPQIDLAPFRVGR
jgi:glycine oxidase